MECIVRIDTAMNRHRDIGLRDIDHRRRLLIFVGVLFALVIDAVNANFLVILLQGRQIFARLGKFTFLHALADVPVDESPLGVHQVELVIESGPGFGDGRGVAQHTDGTLNLGQITPRNHGGRLVVDADLEPSGTPIDKLDGPLGLDGGDGSIDVLGDDISTKEETTCHVLSVTRITFHHLIGGFEASVGNFSNGKLLMVSFLRGNNGRVGGQWEVNSRIRNQVSLELGQIHIQSSVEAQGSRDGGDDLPDETIEVGVGWSLNVEVPPADVVDGFVVDHEGAVGVLQGSVSGQNRVVGLNHRRRHLWRRVDGEFQLGFLAVIDGKPLHEKRGESGAGSSTERVEDEESLKSGALVGGFADAIEDDVDELFADGVMTAGVIVRSVFFASDQLFGMEELAVSSSSDFIDDGGFQVDENSARNVLPGASLAEEGVEGIVSTADGFVRWHLAIGLNSVLEAVELPAGIAHLDSGLSDMNGNDLSHDDGFGIRKLDSREPVMRAKECNF